MKPDKLRLRHWLSRFHFAIRVIWIALIVLLLHYPVSLIHEQVSEREKSKAQAKNDIAEKWGTSQIIVGPRLIVPYYHLNNESEPGKPVSHEKRYASFLPDSLNVTSQINNDARYRGIFSIPVYSGNMQLSGKFSRPDFSKLGLANAIILWNEATIQMEVSDARAIQKNVVLQWGKQKLDFKPGLSIGSEPGQGFHVAVANLLSHDHFDFNLQFDVNGSHSLSIAPVGKQNAITMKSNWSDPSF